MTWRNQIVNADVMDYLRTLPDDTVDCCVTSPPYWQQRDYGVDGQIGREGSVDEFIATLVSVFDEVRRVLKPSGTCWVNLGDTYNNYNSTKDADETMLQFTQRDSRRRAEKQRESLHKKQLLLVPQRFIIAMQDAGWIVRQIIIWHKLNGMPESANDRCTTAHEYIFLLAKSPRYWFDAEAIKTPTKEASRKRMERAVSPEHKMTEGASGQRAHTMHKARQHGEEYHATMANARSVWSISNPGMKGAHFAAYPLEVPRRAILAGCPPLCCATCGKPYVRQVEKTVVLQDDVSEARNIRGLEGQKQTDDVGSAMHGWGGWPRASIASTTLGWLPTCGCEADTVAGVVIDPFMGSGTTALAALGLHRDYCGCELSAEYHALAEKRLREGFSEADKDMIAQGLQLPMWMG